MLELLYMCQISFHIKPVEDLSIWHDFSLKCFFEKCLMSEHKRAEAPNFSHENKATAWTDFKNFFAWLMGMKKLIFCFNNFFGSSHFLIHQIWTKGQKSAWAKKFVIKKISFFMPVNYAKEFLKSIHSSAAAVLYFYNFWPVYSCIQIKLHVCHFKE